LELGIWNLKLEIKGDGVDVLKIIVAGGSEKPYFLKKYGMTEKGCFIRETVSNSLPIFFA